MQSNLAIALLAFVINQISGQNCPAFAPNVATSSLKSTGTGPPSSGTTCPNGGICFALNGVDSCYVCADASSSCSNWNTNGFCSSTSYTTQYKRSYCPKTCGYCSSTTSTCTDASTSCATWNSNGLFCSSTYYTTAQKTQYCASTCGLCSGK